MAVDKFGNTIDPLTGQPLATVWEERLALTLLTQI